MYKIINSSIFRIPLSYFGFHLLIKSCLMAVKIINSSSLFRFLLSVGKDGNFFVSELMNEEMQEQHVQEYKAKIPSARVGRSLRLSVSA